MNEPRHHPLPHSGIPQPVTDTAARGCWHHPSGIGWLGLDRNIAGISLCLCTSRTVYSFFFSGPRQKAEVKDLLRRLCGSAWGKSWQGGDVLYAVAAGRIRNASLKISAHCSHRQPECLTGEGSSTYHSMVSGAEHHNGGVMKQNGAAMLVETDSSSRPAQPAATVHCWPDGAFLKCIACMV